MPIVATDSELDYRAKKFKDFKSINRKQIVCASCGSDLHRKLTEPGGLFLHPFTESLQCKKCHNFYGDGDFSMDEDSEDKYCRICGNGGKLYICSNKDCPYGFCWKCITRYMGNNSSDVEADDWKCLHCNCKPLWEARAVCAAIMKENPQKPRKHNIQKTRSERYKSDDDSASSEDLENDFENSKLINRRRSRRIHSSKNDDGRHSLKKLRSRYNERNAAKDSLEPLNKIIDKSKLPANEPRSGSNRKRLISDSKKSDSDENDNSELVMPNGKDQPNSQKVVHPFEQVKKLHQREILSKTSADPKKRTSGIISVNDSVRFEKKIAMKSHPRLSDTSEDSTMDFDVHESVDNYVGSKRKKLFRDRNLDKTKSAVLKRAPNSSRSWNSMTSTTPSSSNAEVVAVDKGRQKAGSEALNNDVEVGGIDKFMKNRKTETEGRGMKHFAASTRYDEAQEPKKTKGKETRAKSIGKYKVEHSLQRNRLSMNANSRKVRPLFPITREDEVLDIKKATIKRSYGKILSNKVCVGERQATILKKHVVKLVESIKFLAGVLIHGVKKITDEQLSNDFTKVSNASKVVYKCAMLINRYKEGFDEIEQKFESSYKDWCRCCGVEGISFDMKDCMDISSDEEVSKMKRCSSINVTEKNVSAVVAQTDRIIENTNHSIHVSDNNENLDERDELSNAKPKLNDKSGNNSTDSRCEDDLLHPSSVNQRSSLSKKVSNNFKGLQKTNEIEEYFVKDKSAVDQVYSQSESKDPVHSGISECDSSEIFSEVEDKTLVKNIGLASNNQTSVLIADVQNGSKMTSTIFMESGQQDVASDTQNATEVNESESTGNATQEKNAIQPISNKSTAHSTQLDSSIKDVHNNSEVNDSISTWRFHDMLDESQESLKVKQERIEEHPLGPKSLENTDEIAVELSDCEGSLIFTQVVVNNAAQQINTDSPELDADCEEFQNKEKKSYKEISAHEILPLENENSTECHKDKRGIDSDTDKVLSDDTGTNFTSSTSKTDPPENDDIQNNQVDDGNSEESLKKKLLESDSDFSDEGTKVTSELDSFQLRLTSEENSEEFSKPSTDFCDARMNEIPSKIIKTHLNDTMKNNKSQSISHSIVDIRHQSSNELAKRRLLHSSFSSSSDSDEMLLPSVSDSHDSSSGSIFLICPDEKSISKSNRCTVGEKTFNIENSDDHKQDKKLRFNCKVVVRKLDQKVLEPFKQSLEKSKRHLEKKSFKSLIDLSTVTRHTRGASNRNGSSSDSSSSKSSVEEHTKKKKLNQVPEKEETLMDHLEKVKNGEDHCDLSSDDMIANNDILKGICSTEGEKEELAAKADQFAKQLLLQSSDSEDEMDKSLANKKEQEEVRPESQKAKDKGQKKTANAEAEDLASTNDNVTNTENEESEDIIKENEQDKSKKSYTSDSDGSREKKKLKNMLANHNWRLTDSDSSSDEKKLRKSQLKKEQKSLPEKDDSKVKLKKKGKRRALGSDSDAVKLTDLSNDSDDKQKSGSGSEDSAILFNSLRKKRRKRNDEKKSDSDSESDEDAKRPKQTRKRIKKMASDSDSDALNNSQDTPGKLHRKNIRKLLKDKQVADVTKIAGKEEEERLKRIAERQKLYNEMYEMKLASEQKVDKLILDFDEETKKELISVHEGLVARLKPHQAKGIKFMWDACFESLERSKSTKGSGCIVAHCMGLGKTFQVVTLAHTLLTHPEIGIKTIMVICPLSTVLNWVNEFKSWLGSIDNGSAVKVFEMTKMKKNFERKFQLDKWHRTGGVMVLGYEMFRLLSNQTGKKMRKSLHEAILKCLVDPGPDLIVCDEGHLLKNEDTALSKAMRRVKTLRRIVLTGTPLQNNLVEYHCMVQFVKPNLLGTKKEFLNRFVNPITNGQFDDSTEYDVKLMKKRAHVLHKMLEGSVQRFDYSVLTPFLPPKQEYVIFVRLTDTQIKLYQHYIDNYSRKTLGAGSLFADFQALQRIWTHPIVLRMNAERIEKLNEKRRLESSDSEGSLKDFIDDGSDSKSTTTEDSDIQSAHDSSDEKTSTYKSTRSTRANPIDVASVKMDADPEPVQSSEWWRQFVEPEHLEDMRTSSKLLLLFAILKESEQIGDKVLVFSQSLYALSLIEEFLGKVDDETQNGKEPNELLDGHTGSWSPGLDYFRLDGQTPPETRSQCCKIFNNPKNSRARLFLISTRAGGLGINLTAANRVIIFDASWNPSHDVQSIFRIYRFGQKKPCYVYRFLAQGTMEEKIYNRQVTKLSLSCRVVDEQQIERHYSNHDLAELYQFEPNTKEKPTLNLPKDRLLAEILRKYEDRVETFHEHDSLLENKAEEELDEEERKEAWKEYEDERKGRKIQFNNFNNPNFALHQYNELISMNQAEIAQRAALSGINIENLQALIQKDYPNATPEQQQMMTTRTIMDMYTYMENETIRRQQMAAAQYNLQQQQFQQLLVQRDQQTNYAKRMPHARGPIAGPTVSRQAPVVDLHLDDNDIIEVPSSPVSAAGSATSPSVQAPSVSTPPGNSKSQEE
ncbi:transcriptional regulator ATRX-like [Athalia rosae]|uniref:transcriptional regulator ATRX-like n=1 Tax=Athalia rosae TaxID=37344 RepID=UPI0020342AF4|nr:transcriptional regulator ATRX-like [Athalia rosae]